MLRDEIAYEIYKTGRASKATMPFKDFVENDGSAFILELKGLADRILAIMRDVNEKPER